ncbi:MAG: tetratricopeptide repeat protein [Candidatus Woesearchaeota archaeon]|nr:tetratricopeptide repeat protein [Candidatus Woesearchaeota archaeon]
MTEKPKDTDQAKKDLGDILRAFEVETVVVKESLRLAKKDAETFYVEEPKEPPKPAGETFSGTAVRQYEKISLLGKGGMGEVLKARETSCGREVALKRVLEVKDQHAIELFVREATVHANLFHPNIPPILEPLNIDAEGKPYFTMAVVRGESLTKIVEKLYTDDKDYQRRYTVRKRLDIFHKVLDAMDYAHSEGIVHRDLKPDNIMVGKFGEVLVMDWGLAKIRNEKFAEKLEKIIEVKNDQLSMDGTVMGTITYMSPEQALGEINAVDERSDIYALGGVLYNLLCFETSLGMERFRPWNAANQSRALAAIATGDIIPLNERGIKDRDLVRIVMKCLAKRSKDRYQSVADLIKDIEAHEGEIDLSSGEFLRDASEIIVRGGSHKMALANITRAISVDPLSPDAYFARGQLLMEQGDGNGAVQAFEQMNKVIKKRTGRESPRAVFYAGEAARHIIKDTAKAMTFYERCTQLKEDEKIGENVFSLLSAALLQLQKSEVHTAVKSLEKIVGLDESFAEAYELLGCIHADFFVSKTVEGLEAVETKIPLEFYDIGKSIKYFTLAIENSSGKKLGDYYGLRSMAMLKAGITEKARADIKEAILKNPSLTNQNRRLFIYKKLGDWGKALEICNNIIDLMEVNSFHMFFNRGTINSKLGNYQKARDDYQTALKLGELTPADESDVYCSIGICFRKENDLEKALENHKKAVEVYPKNYEALNNIADILHERGDFDGAIKECTKAVVVNENFALGYLTRGMAFFRRWERDQKKDDFKISYSDIQKSLKLRLEDEYIPYAHEYLGRIYIKIGESLLKKGDHQKAASFYDKALKLEHLPTELVAKAQVDMAEAQKHLGTRK